MEIPAINVIKNNIKHIKQYTKKYFPEFYDYVENNFKGKTFSEKIYRYFHPKEGKCKICGKETSFINFKRGFRLYCSCKCSNQLTKEHLLKGSIEKYGSIKEMCKQKLIKSKQTNLKKYGTESPMQNDLIKEKLKRVCLKKYGGLGIASPVLKEKIKQTCIKKYGVENISKSDIIKQKKINTCRDHYGVDNPIQNDLIKKKTSDTKQKNNIYNKDYLIGYTNDGNWICKCPHPNTCNQCKEKFYITKKQIQYDRTRNNSEICTKLFPIGSNLMGISNNSQIYFDQLNKYFPDSIYYKKSGYEYKAGKYSLDFYIPSLKIDIEFNGILYHMKPSLYKPEDINPINNKLAQEIWDHDKGREEYIESKGIKVVIIWEDDLPNPKELYDKIIGN